MPGDDALRSLPLELFPHLVQTLPAMVYVITDDPSPVCLYVSPQAEELSGYPPEDWMADPGLAWRLLHPDDRERIEREWAEARATGHPVNAQYRLLHRDGRVIWMEDVARLVRAEDGTPRFWQGIVFDVTERRRAETAQADSEARYRALVERLPGVVYLCTDEPDPVMIYVAPSLLELTGFTAEAWMEGDQQLWDRTIHPRDRRRVLDAWEEAVRTRTTFQADYRIVRADGTERWITDWAELVAADDRGNACWQGLMRDVTEERANARALQDSEARYRALVEQVPAVVYRMGPDDERRTLYVSPHVEAVLGYTRHEWLEQPDIWVELLHPDDREIELDAHDRLTETGEPWIQEYRLIANDGRTVWIRDQGALIRDPDGEAVWQGVMLDITALKDLEHRLRDANDTLELRVLERTTELEEANEMMSLEIEERRRVEAELRETRERYRHLIDDLPAVVYLCQASGFQTNHAYTSPQIERMLGYLPEEWNEPSFWIERLHPHDRDRVLEASRRSAATGEPFEEEFRYFAKDGHIVWVLSHATLLQRDDAGLPLLFQGVLLDITERKEAEAEAADAEAQLSSLSALGSVTLFDFDVGRDEEARVAFRYVTPALAALIGCTAEELQREPGRWIQGMHPDDRDAVLADVTAQLETGAPSNRTYRMIDPTGRIAWVRTQARCIARDARGRPTRFQGVIIDITPEMAEVERAQRSEEALRAFVDKIPGAPWIEVQEGGPGTGRIVFVGPQVEELLGFTPEELIAEARHSLRIVHPDDRERVSETWRRHERTGEPYAVSYRVHHRDGRVIRVRELALSHRDERGRRVWYGVTYAVSPHDVGPPERIEADAGSATDRARR